MLKSHLHRPSLLRSRRIDSNTTRGSWLARGKPTPSLPTPSKHAFGIECWIVLSSHVHRALQTWCLSNTKLIKAQSYLLPFQLRSIFLRLPVRSPRRDCATTAHVRQSWARIRNHVHREAHGASLRIMLLRQVTLERLAQCSRHSCGACRLKHTVLLQDSTICMFLTSRQRPIPRNFMGIRESSYKLG